MFDQYAPHDPKNGEMIPQSDGKLLVHFYRQAVQNQVKTKEHGRAIFDEIDYIEIRIPGDKNSVICRKTKDTDQFEFPRQWERYKAGLETQTVGTLLEHWGRLTPSQISELQAFNIRTVENLSEVTDAHIGKWIGLRDLRDKAKAFIAASADAAVVSQLQNALEERDQKIEELSEKLENLSAVVAAMQTVPEAAAAGRAVSKAPKERIKAQ